MLLGKADGGVDIVGCHVARVGPGVADVAVGAAVVGTGVGTGVGMGDGMVDGVNEGIQLGASVGEAVGTVDGAFMYGRLPRRGVGGFMFNSLSSSSNWYL